MPPRDRLFCSFKFLTHRRNPTPVLYLPLQTERLLRATCLPSITQHTFHQLYQQQAGLDIAKGLSGVPVTFINPSLPPFPSHCNPLLGMVSRCRAHEKAHPVPIFPPAPHTAWSESRAELPDQLLLESGGRRSMVRQEGIKGARNNVIGWKAGTTESREDLGLRKLQGRWIN